LIFTLFKVCGFAFFLNRIIAQNGKNLQCFQAFPTASTLLFCGRGFLRPVARALLETHINS